MGKESPSVAEEIFGVSLTPGERKLLVMKREVVYRLKHHPAEFTALKRAYADIGHPQARLTGLPNDHRETLEDCIKSLDGSGIKSTGRVLVNMVIFQIESIIEAVEQNGDK